MSEARATAERGPSPEGLAPLGAVPEAGGTRFRVIAPEAESLEVVVEATDGPDRVVTLTAGDDGVHECFVDGVTAGARYRYRLNGRAMLPDPASRYQPDGVHESSEVVDSSTFAWRHTEWADRPLERTVLYELHVGTFTPAGTFAAAIERLTYLRILGVTAIELMPVHDFPGERNWGYDAAALYAPARCYGRPDDLRSLIDAAHGLGLTVILDVVYNHLGPDGAYAATFHRGMLNGDRPTPWGASIHLDGPNGRLAREFLIQNALYWQREFRVDGFRLDATHALHDSSEPHFLEELARRLREAAEPRSCVLIAEDGRNLNTLLHPSERGGYGLDGEWAMDLHHQLHRVVTGERNLYYAGFRGSTEDLARAITQGWIYTGQHDPYTGGHRGTDPGDIPAWRFVSYLQNHDEVGNRPQGDRLPAIAGLAAYRAAMALLLTSPQTPMLFMGDEWGASTPFLFFTDHKTAIGNKIADGRQAFFVRWAGPQAEGALPAIPDPQAPETFEASRLNWDESQKEPHASTLRYVRRLLKLRRDDPAMRSDRREDFEAHGLRGRSALLLRRASGAPTLAVVAAFEGGNTVRVPEAALGNTRAWKPVFSSEDREFAPDPGPLELQWSSNGLEIRFGRPGAVVLRGPVA